MPCMMHHVITSRFIRDRDPSFAAWLMARPSCGEVKVQQNLSSGLAPQSEAYCTYLGTTCSTVVTVVDLHARFFFRFFLLMSKKGVPSLPSRGRVNLCLPVHVAYSTLRVVVGAAERSESSESSRLSGALWSSLFGKFSSAPCDAFAPLHLSLAR
jgi:hypothetical protein